MVNVGTLHDQKLDDFGGGAVPSSLRQSGGALLVLVVDVQTLGAQVTNVVNLSTIKPWRSASNTPSAAPTASPTTGTQ